MLVEGIDYGKAKLTKAEKRKAKIKAEVISARKSATPYAKIKRKTGGSVISARRKAGKLKSGAIKTHKKARRVRKHWKQFKSEMDKLDIGMAKYRERSGIFSGKSKRKKRKRRKAYGRSVFDFDAW